MLIAENPLNDTFWALKPNKKNMTGPGNELEQPKASVNLSRGKIPGGVQPKNGKGI